MVSPQHLMAWPMRGLEGGSIDEALQRGVCFLSGFFPSSSLKILTFLLLKCHALRVCPICLYNSFIVHLCTHIYVVILKGSVQRKLRPMLLYIIRKLFSRRWTAKYLNFCLLKGHFKIYIKPLQRSCPSPVTFACKCYSPSANCVSGQ